MRGLARRNAAGCGSRHLRHRVSKRLRTERHLRRHGTVRPLEQRRLQDGRLRRDFEHCHRGFEMQRPGCLRIAEASHMRALSVQCRHGRLLRDLHYLCAVCGAHPVRFELVRSQGQRRSVHERLGLCIHELRRRLLLRHGVLGAV